MNSRHTLFLVGFLALTGILFLWFSTPWGIGLFPDSASYLSAARSLLGGWGMREIPGGDHAAPFTRYGPLFPILIAAAGFFQVEPLTGARLLNTLLFGMNIFLAGFIVFRYTRSLWPSLLSSFVLLTSFVILKLHAMAVSEPALLFFGFLGLYGLAVYLDNCSKKLFLAAAIGFISLAFLTKYSGVSVVMTVVLSILLFHRGSLLQRITRAFLSGGLACVPMVVWVVRNQIVSGSKTGTGLSLGFYPYLWTNLRELLAYPSVWLLPQAVPKIVRALFLLLAVTGLTGAAFFVFLRSNSEDREGERSQLQRLDLRNLPHLLLLVVICHVGVYLMTTTFLGGQPIDDRALSPVYMALVLFVILTGCHLWQMAVPSHWARRGLAALSCFFVVTYLLRALYWSHETRTEGLGYASPRWKNSEVIQSVRGLPAGTLIYTNGMDALYLLTGRPSSAVPAKQDTLKEYFKDSSERYLATYSSETIKMKQNLLKENGLLVYLDHIDWRWYYPTKQELVQEVSLEVVRNFSDGTVFKAKDEMAQAGRGI